MCLATMALVNSALALPVEDHGAPRSSQRLVRGGGDHVCIFKGRRDGASDHQTGDVRHVRQKVCATLVRNLTHAAVVNQPAVGTGAGNQDLGTDAKCKLFALVIVNEARVFIQAIRDRLEVLGYHGDLFGVCLVAVRQVASNASRKFSFECLGG